MAFLAPVPRAQTEKFQLTAGHRTIAGQMIADVPSEHPVKATANAFHRLDAA